MAVNNKINHSTSKVCRMAEIQAKINQVFASTASSDISSIQRVVKKSNQ